MNDPENTRPLERMRSRIVLWSLTSALAGFLFGFDTVVISGAEQTLQQLWSLDPAVHGVVLASALYGTVLGSVLGGWPTDRFGRKKTLLAIGVLYVVSAVWSGLAQDASALIAARLLGGLGIGISTVAAPLYISEIAPPRYRGLLAGMFQFNIVFGIIIAYLSNALLAPTGEDAWRWMLGIAAVPSVIYLFLCVFIPESPRWLLGKRRDRAAGLAVLKTIQPDAPQEQIEREADAIVAASSERKLASRFWSQSLRTPILLAFLVAFFNQMSGINAVLYFAPRIFEMAGLARDAAMLQSVGIGVTNLIFTLVGIALIDRLGRRTMLYVGSWGYIGSLGLTAWAFYTGGHAIIPFAIFAFIAAHAVGQGAVIWVLISEVFPNQHRAEGQALGSFTHWVFAALLTSLFPLAVARVAPEFIFLFFCGMMVLQLIWVRTMVPETKGVPLEEMQQRIGH